LEIALLVVSSAIQRQESRGAHYRVDYPSKDESFSNSIVLSRSEK
jgi:succinate dehydrogenase/fumarate reductase flavoprotein subunit